MESSSEINQSFIQGYSTPPRSEQPSSFSQPKLLTSSELKRRFSPIHSSNKKRRHNLIRKSDGLVPLERNLNMPMILPKLFDDNNKEELSLNEDDCIVPMSSSKFSIKSSKIIPRQSIFDCLIPTNSFKIEQENTFSISETIMKEKLKILLQKK